MLILGGFTQLALAWVAMAEEWLILARCCQLRSAQPWIQQMVAPHRFPAQVLPLYSQAGRRVQTAPQQLEAQGAPRGMGSIHLAQAIVRLLSLTLMDCPPLNLRSF